MKYKYDKEQNTLRQLPEMRESYPCSGEGWEDGKEYEEGEFEVKVVEVYSSGGSSRYNDYKLPNGEIITCHRDTPPKVAVLKQKEDATSKKANQLISLFSRFGNVETFQIQSALLTVQEVITLLNNSPFNKKDFAEQRVFWQKVKEHLLQNR